MSLPTDFSGRTPPWDKIWYHVYKYCYPRILFLYIFLFLSHYCVTVSLANTWWARTSCTQALSSRRDIYFVQISDIINILRNLPISHMLRSSFWEQSHQCKTDCGYGVFILFYVNNANQNKMTYYSRTLECVY